MKRRLLGLVLAGVMVTSLSACGSEEVADTTVKDKVVEDSAQQTPKAESVQETQGVKEEEVAKPESISWWSHDGLNEQDYVKEWDAEFEKKTGIKMEHTQISNNEYSEMLELAFASGTEPNVFDLSCDQKLAYFASQGGVADLTELVKNSELYEKIDKAVWDAISIDGRIYGIPKGRPSGIESYVRQDWLDELGMSAPTNYDEYIEMLRAFKNNIDECTIPVTAPGLSSAMNLPEFYQDAEVGFTKVDGKWVDGMSQDNFAGAMQRIRDAYAEGLIDVEAITNTTSACRDKWYSGEVGVFSYWGGKWGDTLTNRLKENFPEAAVTGIDAIDESYYRYSSFTVYAIDGRLSEEEVEQVFKYFLEYINDGDEGWRMYYCGVEGVHYEFDENGNMKYLNMSSAPENKFQSIWGTPWESVTAYTGTGVTPQPSDIVVETLATLQKTGVYLPTTPVSETLNMITSDLTAIKQETIANIVLGKVSVEDGLADYRSKAQALGIEQVLEELNAQ